MTPITTTAELQAFCDKIKGQAFVAVDTEFMRETTYWPKLCLIQAAARNAEAVIDPLADGHGPVSRCWTSCAIRPCEKVFHAARQDVEIFNNLDGHAGRRCSTPRWPGWPQGSASRSPMTLWCARC
jgi:ribonuclease D